MIHVNANLLFIFYHKFLKILGGRVDCTPYALFLLEQYVSQPSTFPKRSVFVNFHKNENQMNLYSNTIPVTCIPLIFIILCRTLRIYILVKKYTTGDLLFTAKYTFPGSLLYFPISQSKTMTQLTENHHTIWLVYVLTI